MKTTEKSAIQSNYTKTDGSRSKKYLQKVWEKVT